MTAGWAIPDYMVRESRRARRMTIKVSSWTGLEVVVPIGFDRNNIAEFVESKARWIRKALERTHPVEELKRPESIQLGLLDDTWSVEYSPSQQQRLSLLEKPGNVLLLTGAVNSPVTVAAALNHWLQKKAARELKPWLGRLGAELSLPFSRVSVRRQKTKWGSCSAEKSISLNRNLLFLPGPMARYVLVHELCHCRRLDHSKKFWDLLETFEPNARQTAAKVREASESVPRWAMV
ncbi:MAG: M48 family metallopeptidase [Chloroflexi bacterium]|nr:M48 family metallopeptidase [Chloroflexota bacterium]